MKIRSLLLFFVSFVGLLQPALSAETLADRMTEEQFATAGLDKLSEAELRYLTRWIDGEVTEERERTIAEIIPEGDDRFGAEEQIRNNVEKVRPEPKQITSRIPGKFNGWKGKGVRFELENGQVWRTTERDHFAVRLEDPTVTIKKGLFGAYYLSVEGFGSRVKVERVE